jgi:hypothetical protein
MRPWCKGVNIGGMGRGRHCEKGEHESRLVAMKRHFHSRRGAARERDAPRVLTMDETRFQW